MINYYQKLARFNWRCGSTTRVRQLWTIQCHKNLLYNRHWYWMRKLFVIGTVVVTVQWRHNQCYNRYFSLANRPRRWQPLHNLRTCKISKCTVRLWKKLAFFNLFKPVRNHLKWVENKYCMSLCSIFQAQTIKNIKWTFAWILSLKTNLTFQFTLWWTGAVKVKCRPLQKTTTNIFSKPIQSTRKMHPIFFLNSQVMRLRLIACVPLKPHFFLTTLGIRLQLLNCLNVKRW